MKLIERASQRRALITLALLAPLAAAAQSAGDKPPLRLLVGFNPGGNVDWVARALAEKLRIPLGRTIVVDNKPGAGSRIAMSELKRMPPDGNTLAVNVDAAFTMYPHTVAKLEYDATKDFTPIARIATFDYAIAVANSHPAHTIKEFLDWAGKNPKDASVASPGPGSGPSFVAQELARTAGVGLTDVPTRGGAAANGDVIGGTIAATSGVLPDMLELHRGGKLRVLAVGGAKRSSLLPDVPTLRESGMPFDGDISISLYGPASLPASAVAALLQAITAMLADPDTRAAFTKQGLTPAALPPDQLAALHASESRKWQGIVKSAGYVPQ